MDPHIIHMDQMWTQNLTQSTDLNKSWAGQDDIGSVTLCDRGEADFHGGLAMPWTLTDHAGVGAPGDEVFILLHIRYNVVHLIHGVPALYSYAAVKVDCINTVIFNCIHTLLLKWIAFICRC